LFLRTDIVPSPTTSPSSEMAIPINNEEKKIDLM
jgi:hypothetical protein